MQEKMKVVETKGGEKLDDLGGTHQNIEGMGVGRHK